MMMNRREVLLSAVGVGVFGAATCGNAGAAVPQLKHEHPVGNWDGPVLFSFRTQPSGHSGSEILTSIGYLAIYHGREHIDMVNLPLNYTLQDVIEAIGSLQTLADQALGHLIQAQI